MATAAVSTPVPRARAASAWWPLLALTLLAAALRFSTLHLQSFWYDEAFTPVHVLRASLWATLRDVSRTENTPPLWYLLEWFPARLFGTGEVSLRLLSALAGTLTVPVAWAIGRELIGRERVALACAAFVAVNPLFVWYSQEARAYALYALMVALAVLAFLHALHHATPMRLIAFAFAGALALLTHYFAVFLLIPMCLWLLYAHRQSTRGLRNVALAVGAVALVGLALIPLIVAQGGHGTQWIGRWPLAERLEAIPQYYLTGASGKPLGHGLQLLVALPILAGLFYGLWRGLTRWEERRALIMLVLSVTGVLLPLVLIAFGLDYLAPRNLIGAMIPLTALLAMVIACERAGRIGLVLAGLVALAFLAIAIDVDLSPRLQRGDWRDLTRSLPAIGPGGSRQEGISPLVEVVRSVFASGSVVTTTELGSAPLEYYRPLLHNLPRGATVTVREINETGYAPLRPGAAQPPAPGFRLVQRSDFNGILLYRFVSSTPRTVSEAVLREHVITEEHPEVLVP